jgi:hypothetical protein
MHTHRGRSVGGGSLAAWQGGEEIELERRAEGAENILGLSGEESSANRRERKPRGRRRSGVDG